MVRSAQGSEIPLQNVHLEGRISRSSLLQALGIIWAPSLKSHEEPVHQSRNLFLFFHEVLVDLSMVKSVVQYENEEQTANRQSCPTSVQAKRSI